MNIFLKIFCILIFVVGSFFSCQSCPPAPPLEWNFEKEAIYIFYRSDYLLNEFDNSPHALESCIYQLKDPNTFNQLSQDKEGVKTLLKCTLFDSSVAKSDRKTILPGRKEEMIFDRAEGARYIGIIAGYYSLDPERIKTLFKIPIKKKCKGFFNPVSTSTPCILRRKIEFGRAQLSVYAFEKDKSDFIQERYNKKKNEMESDQISFDKESEYYKYGKESIKEGENAYKSGQKAYKKGDEVFKSTQDLF